MLQLNIEELQVESFFTTPKIKATEELLPTLNILDCSSRCSPVAPETVGTGGGGTDTTTIGQVPNTLGCTAACPMPATFYCPTEGLSCYMTCGTE